jgi:hypothetical protein
MCKILSEFEDNSISVVEDLSEQVDTTKKRRRLLAEAEERDLIEPIDDNGSGDE